MTFVFKVIKLFRNVTFLLMLCFSLMVSTAVMTVQAVMLGTEVAAQSAVIARSAVQNRRAIVRAVARAKAKARLRRVIAAVPVAGIAAVGYFERRDFVAWQEGNPDGTLNEYSCKVATVSAEVIDEVLQELPERARLSPDFVLSYLPECEGEND